MKKLIFLLLSALGFSSIVFAETLNLMVFGDSLSAGYKLGPKNSFANQLEKALQKKGYPVQIINYSFSGATTADGVHRLKGALTKEVDGVILELGANDMLRHVDLDTTTKNLQKLIFAFKNAKVPVMLVGMKASPTHPVEYQQAFQQMYADLALQNELLLYPFFMQGLWTDEGKHVSNSYFLEDKMHPSEKGVAVMVKHILPAVEQFIAEDIADVTIKEGH